MQLQQDPSFHQTVGLTEQPFVHDALYQYWFRSQGIWFSKLVKVAVRFLNAHELLNVGQLHGLNDTIEFGVRMQWEYYTKDECGHMSWCVDATHPNIMFSDRSVISHEPQVLHYTMPHPDELKITLDDLEERFCLQSNRHQLRELRRNGRLLRRLWEHKFSP
jgi:hypothetical protein